MPADQAEEGRGRRAEWPIDIPRRGWWDILMRVKDAVSRTNASLVAAGLAFYAFLAIPSALSALVALYGLLFNPAQVGQQIEAMRGVMPQEAIKLVSDELTAITTSPNSKLGWAFALSVVVALWSARSGTSSLMSAINIAYEEREKRSFLRFSFNAFAMTLAIVAFTILALALVAVLPAVIDLLPLGSFDKTLASVLRWPLLVALVMVSLSAIYRFAPSREQAKWRWVSPGAAAATVLWIAGSALFSLYVSTVASYDKSYGSLGAVVVLLMWLYVTSFAIILGAGLNAEIEHQTARDSTTGPPLPMGQRGATMADTLGEKR